MMSYDKHMFWWRGIPMLQDTILVLFTIAWCDDNDADDRCNELLTSWATCCL